MNIIQGRIRRIQQKRRAMELEKDLKHKFYEESLRELEVFRLDKRMIRRDFITLISYLTGEWSKIMVISSATYQMKG